MVAVAEVRTVLERREYGQEESCVHLVMVSCPLCDEWDRDSSAGAFYEHLFFEHEVQDLPGIDPIEEDADD